jgi:hypothetical protein
MAAVTHPPYPTNISNIAISVRDLHVPAGGQNFSNNLLLQSAEPDSSQRMDPHVSEIPTPDEGSMLGD